MKKQYILDKVEFDELSSKLHNLMWRLYDAKWAVNPQLQSIKKEALATLSEICAELEEAE